MKKVYYERDGFNLHKYHSINVTKRNPPIVNVSVIIQASNKSKAFQLRDIKAAPT